MSQPDIIFMPNHPVSRWLCDGDWERERERKRAVGGQARRQAQAGCSLSALLSFVQGYALHCEQVNWKDVSLSLSSLKLEQSLHFAFSPKRQQSRHRIYRHVRVSLRRVRALQLRPRQGHVLRPLGKAAVQEGGRAEHQQVQSRVFVRFPGGG